MLMAFQIVAIYIPRVMKTNYTFARDEINSDKAA